MDKFRSLTRHLRRDLPASGPVTVRLHGFPLRHEKPNYHGDCGEYGKGYRVRVEKKLSEPGAIGVLLHEWAHALSYGLDLDDDHGEWFVEAKRDVWRAYRRWLIGGDEL